MTGKENENMWSAYMDGELSAAEAAEFDASLSESDRDRLASEIRFESALAERLQTGAPCPDKVWEDTLAKLKAGARREEAGKTRTTWRSALRLAPLAAVILVAVALFLLWPRNGEAAFLTKAASVAALASQAQVYTPEAVRLYLRDHGVNLALKDPSEIDMRGHTGTLIGATKETFGGETVVEVLYECCGSPVKLVVVPEDGKAAGAIRSGQRDGRVQAVRACGDYMVVVVSDHPSQHLLAVFDTA